MISLIFLFSFGGGIMGNYYRHGLVRNFFFTSGVKKFCEKKGAFWLVDVIASYQIYPHIRTKPFQVWILKKRDDDSAVVTMQEDAEEPIVVKQEIPLTDFSDNEAKLWVENGVLLLPEEH